jgi:hypothetical protein
LTAATAVVAADAPAVGCKAEIEWQVAPEAEIVQFDCDLGDHKGTPSLIFKAGIKNTSDKPLRFRLNVFLLDSDKAVGHLVPAKGDPPVVAAGKTETVTVPAIGVEAVSQKLLVIVKPIDM